MLLRSSSISQFIAFFHLMLLLYNSQIIPTAAFDYDGCNSTTMATTTTMNDNTTTSSSSDNLDSNDNNDNDDDNEWKTKVDADDYPPSDKNRQEKNTSGRYAKYLAERERILGQLEKLDQSIEGRQEQHAVNGSEGNRVTMANGDNADGKDDNDADSDKNETTTPTATTKKPTSAHKAFFPSDGPFLTSGAAASDSPQSYFAPSIPSAYDTSFSYSMPAAARSKFLAPPYSSHSLPSSAYAMPVARHYYQTQPYISPYQTSSSFGAPYYPTYTSYNAPASSSPYYCCYGTSSGWPGGWGGGGNVFNMGLGWGFNLGFPGGGVGLGSGLGVNVG